MALQTRLLRDVYLSRGSNGAIGLDRYPIFDESHREILNEKIVQHYAMREIGFDTDDMFIFELRRKMNEIMPPYNQLYQSETLLIDPMSTVDITTMDSGSTTDSSSTDQTHSGTNSTETKGRGVTSEPPSQQLSANGQYATGVSDSHSTADVSESATTNGTASQSGTRSGESHQTGRGAPQSALIQAYRDIIVNVDMMIVGDLEELFMQILSSPDNDIPRYGTGYPLYGGYPFMMM